jgi:hypothetical protein
VPWQWGPEELGAEDWEVMEDSGENALVGFPNTEKSLGWILPGGNDVHLRYEGSIISEED